MRSCAQFTAEQSADQVGILHSDAPRMAQETSWVGLSTSHDTGMIAIRTPALRPQSPVQDVCALFTTTTVGYDPQWLRVRLRRKSETDQNTKQNLGFAHKSMPMVCIQIDAALCACGLPCCSRLIVDFDRCRACRSLLNMASLLHREPCKTRRCQRHRQGSRTWRGF